MFTYLTFGLCTVPFMLTELTKPVVHSFRSRGLISVIYLDDVLLIAKSENECLSHVPARENNFHLEIFSDASLSGWVISCDEG